jgi:hypothetical protein
VLGYSTFHAGLAILPAALLMVLVAPRSAKLVEARGARFTLLTAGYAAAVGTAIASSPEQQQISTSVESQLTKSFAGATETAQQYPQYASQITAAAKASFLQGDQWAYTAGIVAILLGAALVFFLFPRKQQEERLLARFHTQDTARPAGPAPRAGVQ